MTQAGELKVSPVVEEYQYRFRSGDTIANRYSVERSLGFGGFSEVYLCTDVRLNRQVALKVIPIERLTGEVLNEAQTAASLAHPNITQIIDVALPNENPFYISMPYVSGGTLTRRLDAAEYQRLPLGDEALQILTDIAAALDHAHARGVLHLDVKPSNILLSETGQAILSDFGLAKTKKLPAESAISIGMGLSGTIPYMSPEQINETNVDHRSDIYALGVVAYQMLTGQLPYRGQSTLLIANIARTPAVPARIANSEIPEKVEAVLQKVLSKEPEDRYRSCTDFVKALKAAAQAYIDQAEKYTHVVELIRVKQWRESLSLLQQLEHSAPGYKDVRLLMEQAKKQVQLQDLHSEAESLLSKKDYQGCLDKLNVIAGFEPDYPVGAVREEAQAGLARQQRESLDKQYQRAVQQFNDQAYRACLDTLAIIAEQDPTYPHLERLKPKAQEAWEREQYLTALYRSSQEHSQSGAWDQAVADLVELQTEEPNYPNIENLLTTARHLARMSSIYKRAQQAFSSDIFTDCVDALDELKRIDPHYKQQDVATMRQQAVERLYRQAVKQLQTEAFEQAVQTVAAVGERDSTYGDPENVVLKAEQGIGVRDLKAKLDSRSEEAEVALKTEQYGRALEIWQAIHLEDPRYEDRLDVENRARETWCRQLDTEAREAYDQGQFAAAVHTWDRIHNLDLTYRIPQVLYQRAQNRQKGLASAWKRFCEDFVSKLGTKSVEPTNQGRSKLARPTSLWRWGILAVVAIILSISLKQSGILFGVSLTLTPTPTSTLTPSPMPTPSLATALYATGVFAIPDSSASQIFHVKEETQVTVLGCTRDKNWLYIVIEDVGGYADALAFEWSGDCKLMSIIGPDFTPTPSPTPTKTASLTRTSTPTLTPKATSTGKLTPTFTLTPTPSDDTATALFNSGIYAAPNSSSTQLGYVSEGDQVPVLGRSAIGDWYYIRNAENIEGFAYAPRFQWSGNFDSLPVKPTVAASSPTPSTSTTPTTPGGTTTGNLEMDLWPLDGQCIPGGWYRMVFIGGRGGNGIYTYYWNGEIVGGPMSDGIGFQVRGGSSSIIGKGKVVSGDGQSVERDLYVPALDCGN